MSRSEERDRILAAARLAVLAEAVEAELGPIRHRELVRLKADRHEAETRLAMLAAEIEREGQG